MSILTYRYDAITATGQKTKGTIRAGSEQEAYRKINATGVTPVSLTAVRAKAPLFSFSKVKHQDIVNLTRELAVLVEANIPLEQGLISIAQHEKNVALADMVRDIATQLQSGVSLANALEKHKSAFGTVYIEAMRAAEKSGSLIAVTQHLVEMLERQAENRQMVIRAMTYPLIVLAMVAGALTVIVGFVVPKFAATFAARGVKMPLPTRIVQTVGLSVHDHWYYYLGALVAAIAAWIVTWRHPAGRLVLEKFLAGVPYIGQIIITHTAARFARVMGIGLASGLGVIESITIAGSSTGRPVFANDCSAMASRIKQGDKLADALTESRYLPAFAQRMIGAGKDSKEVSRACDIVARHYDRESSNLTKNINTIIEPLLTVGLAAIVLTVALAVFLPMWQMARIQK